MSRRQLFNNITREVIRPMSLEEIQHYLDKNNINGTVQIYDYLYNFYNANEIFQNRYDVVIILCNPELEIGHWVCLINHGSYIEFFNPYGLLPDVEVEGEVRHKQLSFLLGQSRYEGKAIIINKFSYQDKSKQSVATCGKWCCARAYFKNENLSNFKKKFYSPTPLERDIKVVAFYEKTK